MSTRKRSAVLHNKEVKIPLLNVIQLISDAIALIDQEQRILFFDKGAEYTFGYRAEEVINQPLDFLFTPRFAESQRQRVRDFAIGSKEILQIGAESQVFGVRKDGTEFPVEVSITRFSAGAMNNFIFILRDLSKRMHVEEALRKRTQELGKRVKELNCLYTISSIDCIKEITLQGLLSEVVKALPCAWQYPEIACARILYKDQDYKTENYRDTPWWQCGDIVVRNKKVGLVEVGYLEEKPKSYEGPFLEEERRLINSIGERLGKIIERRISERDRSRLLKSTRQLARQVVAGQELERKHFSRELHDEAGQALVALKLSLESINSELPAELDTLRKQLCEAIDLTNKTTERIRSLAHDLRPLALDTVGLNSTIEGYCRDFARRTRLSIQYQGVDLLNLPESEAISLYRFLQEALTNVVKHAHAQQVKVILLSERDEIILSVEDDGVGFNPQKQKSSDNNQLGIGLLGLQERLEMLDGRLEIRSKPKRGTRLLAILPDRRVDDTSHTG